jgi:hypothetical protein
VRASLSALMVLGQEFHIFSRLTKSATYLERLGLRYRRTSCRSINTVSDSERHIM